MKRPQSAITRIDDVNSTASKPIRPLSGVSDATLRFHNSVDQLISKANYSLQLMNINDSLQLFEQAFKKGEHQLSSIRLVKLVEDVVMQLVKVLIKSEDNLVTQQILNRLLIWCQVTIAYIQIQQSNEDILHIKCPPMLQVRVLNAYGDFLRKQNKYDESTHYLQLSLQMLSSFKFESSIDELVGQTYMLLSTNSLYINHYAQAIQEAQSALQHLQQAAITAPQTQDGLHESICDTYINLGIAKEHEKQFQEAHYNYYSSLVYSQQNLSEARQMKIQQIYDQFLSRQAAYLQKLQFQQQKSFQQFNSVATFARKPITSPQQPFVDMVKNALDNNKLSSNFFKKKQKVMKSIERQRYQEEQAIQKFKPYLNKLPTASSTTRIKPNLLYQSQPFQRQASPFKQPVTNNGIKIMKLSNKPELKTQYNQNNSQFQYKQQTLSAKTSGYQSQNLFSQQSSQVHSSKIQSRAQGRQQQPQQLQKEQMQKYQNSNNLNKQEQPYSIPSQFIQYLEKTINESNNMKNNNNVQLIQTYRNIHLPSIETQTGIQDIYSGTMSIYLFSQQNILYFQYLASEITDQFAENAGQSQIRLIANSLNISDVSNQYNVLNQDPLGMRNFLLSFSIEYFRYAKVNLEKQTFHLPYTSVNQFYIFVSEFNQNMLVQVKNDYESLIFLVEQLDDNGISKEQEIQPIFNHKSNSLGSDDIQPLLAEQAKQIDEDVQPVFEEQEDKLVTSQEYSQDFEPAPIMEQVPQEKYIQKSVSLPPQALGKNQYDGMEKFTIKIESEDQRQQVIEVYATDKKQQQEEEIQEEQDPELNAAALLIQKKFRSKKMNLKN